MKQAIVKKFILLIGLFSSSVSFSREYPLDPQISPCEDFYQYVCHQVIHHFTLPKNRNRYVFSFSDLNEKMLTVKKNYLRRLTKRKPNNKMEINLKNYYLAAINRNARKKEEYQIIFATKKQLSQIQTKKAFLNTAGQNVLKIPAFSFLSLHANLTNQQNNAYNDVTFDIPLLSLPENSYYQNKPLLDEYLTIITDFFKILGSKNPLKQAQIVLTFETQLAQHYPEPSVLRTRYVQPFTLTRQQLRSLTNLCLNDVLTQIPPHTVIRDLVGFEVLTWLNTYLSRVDLDTLKTLALFYQLFPLIDASYPQFYQRKFNFTHKYLGGPLKRPSLQERATVQTMNDFTMEIDAILLPQLFPHFPKHKIQALVLKIRDNLLEQLTQNEWLSYNAKQAALQKIKTLKWYLVAPDNEIAWNFNPQIDYHRQQPIHNSWRLKQALFDFDLTQLKDKVDNQRWWMGPLSVNAYYEPAFNRLVLPIGILQPPFYDDHLSEKINLGAIGVILGHEMGHAVDDQGSCYNAQGLLKPWMSKADQQEFKRRTAKLITLFDQIGHNGQYTLGENIGDLVGITTAYLTLQTLNPSHEEIQAFFQKYACLWCEVERPASRLRRLKTDPHALGEARVNQQLKLQPGFQKAFNCQNNEPMACKEVIKIW